jgi:hypothetical protein
MRGGESAQACEERRAIRRRLTSEAHDRRENRSDDASKHCNPHRRDPGHLDRPVGDHGNCPRGEDELDEQTDDLRAREMVSSEIVGASYEVTHYRRERLDGVEIGRALQIVGRAVLQRPPPPNFGDGDSSRGGSEKHYSGYDPSCSL